MKFTSITALSLLLALAGFSACSSADKRKLISNKKAERIVEATYVKRAAIDQSCEKDKEKALKEALADNKTKYKEWRRFIKRRMGRVKKWRKAYIAKHCPRMKDNSGDDARLAAKGKVEMAADDANDEREDADGDSSAAELSDVQKAAVRDLWGAFPQ